MITITMIALIAAIGSMSIGNMTSNAFARSKHHHHDHMDNEGNNRHVCILQKHVSSDQRHVCIDKKYASRDDQQEEIILSSPGLPQQQLYVTHIHGRNT
jgi:hypothetical protein